MDHKESKGVMMTVRALCCKLNHCKAGETCVTNHPDCPAHTPTLLPPPTGKTLEPTPTHAIPANTTNKEDTGAYTCPYLTHTTNTPSPPNPFTPHRRCRPVHSSSPLTRHNATQHLPPRTLPLTRHNATLTTPHPPAAPPPLS